MTAQIVVYDTNGKRAWKKKKAMEEKRGECSDLYSHTDPHSVMRDYTSSHTTQMDRQRERD